MNINDTLRKKIIDGLIKNDSYTDVEAMEFINELDRGKPASRSEQVVRKLAIKFTSDPVRKYEGYIEYVYGGIPYLDYVEGHEMDTSWRFPLKERRLVSLPPEEKWISQAEYVSLHPTLFKVN